jgi:hypothetical protein
MKIKLLGSVAVLFLAITTVHGSAIAQIPNNTRPVVNKAEEAGKIQNIKKLLEITGTKDLTQQIIAQMLDLMKAEYPQVPEKFWDSFVAELRPDEMIDEFIPLYSKYYSNEEIKQLIAFYQTPVGKKTIAILPQISRDSSAIGLRYGREAAQRALQKLESEGYIRRSK